MLPEIGEYLLQIALGFSVLQVLLFSANERFLRSAASIVFITISVAFGLLIYSFVVSDFSLEVVFQNSHSIKPMIYKISGTWGNHEGSLMMLIWILSLYGFLYSGKKPNKTAMSVYGAIMAMFIAFTLFTSNPFARIFPAPPEGTGLNPLLQDVGLALHPPMLYLGYIGFALTFAIAVAALIQGEFSKDLIKQARKWCIFSWAFLTLGIGLGSWWAYRELGWGGFWFWDPVENASLLPWLAGTALLHSLLIAEKKEALKKWTVLLAIITFSLTLIGFFLVRSGVLTSVHAFANDPERGVFMLGFLIAVAGGGLILFGARAHKLESKGQFASLSRETMILYNNLITCVLTATVLIGTTYPIILKAVADEVISVGPDFFNITVVPFSLVIFVLAGIAIRLRWEEDNFKKLFKKTYKIALTASVFAAALIFIMDCDLYQSVSLILILFLLCSVIAEFMSKKEFLAAYPMILAHGGFAIMALGIMFASSFAEEKEVLMKPNEKLEIAGFDLEFIGVKDGAGQNYVYRRGEFIISLRGEELGKIYPESRIFPVERDKTTEAAIYTSVLSDLYVVIGERIKGDEEAYAVRVYFKPLINLIWLGCVLMFLSGLLRLYVSKKNAKKEKTAKKAKRRKS